MFTDFVGNVSFIDNIVYTLIAYVENIYGYYIIQVNTVAMICFCLTLGIGCLKLFMGVEQLNQFLVKLLISLCTFFVFLWAFPFLMAGIQKVTAEAAYQSVYGKYGVAAVKPLKVDSNKSGGGSPETFKKWLEFMGKGTLLKESYRGGSFLAKEQAILKYQMIGRKVEVLEVIPHGPLGGLNPLNMCDVVFTVSSPDSISVWSLPIFKKKYDPESKAVDNFLACEIALEYETKSAIKLPVMNRGAKNMPIKTSVISITKLLQYMLVPVNIIVNYLITLTGWDGFFKNIVEIIVITSVMFMLVMAFLICMGEYLMCMLLWAFLYGIGVLFIPMMLWEHTKHGYEKLVQAMFKLAVRILITTTILYLVAFINIDVLINMYYIAGGEGMMTGDNAFKIGQSLEYYLMIFCMQFFVFYLANNANNLSEYICRGSMSLGFDNFAQSAQQAAGAIGMGSTVIAAGAAYTALGANYVGGTVLNEHMSIKTAEAARQTMLDSGGTKEQAEVAYDKAKEESFSNAQKHLTKKTIGGAFRVTNQARQKFVNSFATLGGNTRDYNSNMLPNFLDKQKEQGYNHSMFTSAFDKDNRIKNIKENKGYSEKEKNERLGEARGDSFSMGSKLFDMMKTSFSAYSKGAPIKSRLYKKEREAIINDVTKTDAQKETELAELESKIRKGAFKIGIDALEEKHGKFSVASKWMEDLTDAQWEVLAQQKRAQGGSNANP